MRIPPLGVVIGLVVACSQPGSRDSSPAEPAADAIAEDPADVAEPTQPETSPAGDIAVDPGAEPDPGPDPEPDVFTPPDPCLASASLVERVDPARMLADLEALVGLGERTTWEGQQAAADYVRDQLDQLDGVVVTEHEYTVFAAGWVNIEATFPGAELPGEYVFAGAHYDSISEAAATSSPGADDDASGVAALLEIARILDGCAPKRTVRLIFFSNEEEGTAGSEAYVADLPAEVPTEALKVYVNVDMIAFGPDDEDLDLATRPEYEHLVTTMAAAVEEHTDLDAREIIDEHCG